MRETILKLEKAAEKHHSIFHRLLAHHLVGQEAPKKTSVGTKRKSGVQNESESAQAEQDTIRRQEGQIASQGSKNCELQIKSKNTFRT